MTCREEFSNMSQSLKKRERFIGYRMLLSLPSQKLIFEAALIRAPQPSTGGFNQPEH